MGRVVCQKLPVTELVFYFDVCVQKIAKTAKKYHFLAYFDPFLSENGKTPHFPAFFRVWKWWKSLFIFKNLKGPNDKVLSSILQLTERSMMCKWRMFENWKNWNMSKVRIFQFCIITNLILTSNTIFKHSPFAHY